MLGQHLGRAEVAVRLHRPDRDDALALAEQVGQHAAIGHLHRRAAVGYAKPRRRMAVGDRALHAALLDQPAEPEVRPGSRSLAAISDGEMKNTRLSGTRSAPAPSPSRGRAAGQQRIKAGGACGSSPAAARGSTAPAAGLPPACAGTPQRMRRAGSQHTQRVGRSDERQMRHARLVRARHQQRAHATLHHRRPQPRHHDGGEDERVAEC